MLDSQATPRTPRSRILVVVVLGLLVSVSLYYLYPLNVPYRLGTYTKYEVISRLTTTNSNPGRVVMFIHEEPSSYATVDASSYSYTPGAVVTTEKLEHRIGSGIAYNLKAIAWNSTGEAMTYFVKRNVTSYSITYNLWGLESVLSDTSVYLASNDFYPSENPEIKQLANRIVGESRGSVEKARSLFNYVTENIRYNSSYLDVTDVFRVLKEKQAVCEGYSFVYATLLRSVGIPAFVEIGYGYQLSENRGGGHAWVEAWLYSQWVAFDPTWKLFAGWNDNGHLLGELAAYDSDSDVSSVDWAEVRVLEHGVLGVQQGDVRFVILALILLGSYAILAYTSVRAQMKRMRRPPPVAPLQPGPYKYCPHCGSTIPSDSVFCVACGRRTQLEGG